MAGAAAEYLLKPGTVTSEFVFFISSGSDMDEQRDLFEAMVKTVDEQFWHRGDPQRRFHLRTARWEHDAPYRSDDPNADFVRQAKEAHSTVVLLSKQVRAGTQEEIEGALQEPDTQVSVVWMKAEGRVRDGALRKYLESKQGELLYLKTGAPNSIEANAGLLRVIAAALAEITNPRRQEALFYEERD